MLWMELGFAAPSGRGIPAQPLVAAQFCICPGVRGSEVAWMGTRAFASSGGLFLRVGESEGQNVGFVIKKSGLFSGQLL